MLGQGSVRRVLGVALALALGIPAGAAAVPGDDGPSGSTAPDATWAVPAAPQVLTVDTKDAAPVVSKDDYVEGTLQLAGASYPMEIKGRGNSTWKWVKKPYKIKLPDPVSLLGMPAHDEWVLLANYADRSALRNHLAFQLGRRTRLPWTPDTRFVDLVVNGKSLGLYLLTEQVEQTPDRVALPEGGYLLEVDQRFRASGDPGFRTRRRTPVSFKDPDELKRKERRRIKKAVNSFEDVLYGDGFADPVRGYAPLVDVESFVDWYVVEELFRNQDSNFYSSVYVSWTPGDRFALGPLWDFDQSAGTRWNGATAPEGWHTRRGRHWISRMLEDPAFSRLVKARTLELRPLVEELVSQVPAAAQAIRPSALADWPLWHTTGAATPGAVHADSFAGEVEFLQRWLADRVAWMSAPEVTFDHAGGVLQEAGQVVQVPVRVQAGSGPVSVDYAVVGGSATRGEDYDLADGTLRFEQGESVKTFPLTILDDEVAEGRERIRLALRSPVGARAGHPQRLTFSLRPSDHRPDVRLRAGRRGKYVGAGVQDATGRSQSVRVGVRRGRSLTLDLKVANETGARGVYRLSGPGPRRGVAVRWFQGRKDVTRKVRSGRGWKIRVGAGAAKRVRVVVRARPGAAPGKARTFRLRATALGDPVAVDTVRAVVRVRR